MKKFYEKSELGFAIACIVLYVVGASAADNLSRNIGVERCVTLVFLLILAAVLYAFVRRQGLGTYYGLCKSAHSAGKFLFYLPLAVLASVNLWFGAVQSLSLPETVICIVTMLLVGFLEELIFRGFLFRAMSRGNVKSAVVVSSLTFGMGHLVNLINGSGADLAGNLAQVCYAAAIGFLFVILFDRGGSLWPCVMTHGVFNALSAFSNEPMLTRYQPFVTAALIVISLGYALILMRTLPQPARH